MAEALKILVIDDSEDDRLLYRRALQKNEAENYNIIEAADGDEGLRLISEELPDCVLLDYYMPGRDGLEVLKRIRTKHPFIPVVILTGQGNEKVAVSAIQEGAQNYIAKTTITPQAIQRIIRVAIEHCAMEKHIHEQRTSLEIFTRALAHDLKEPVRTISSFLDLIEGSEKLSEKGKGYFTYIQNAAERMNSLIETVYFYTRLDSTEKITRENFDMAKLLEEAKENANQLIQERKAIITNDDLPEVNVNRTQFIQLIQNLVCNAIQHCKDTPEIHIGAEEKTDHWLFSVSDNGPGIDGSNHEKIFQPFKRLSHSKEQGLGLGLAICKKIVELHGGKIWYEPHEGKGATFSFTIPKVESQKVDSTSAVSKNSNVKSLKQDNDRPLANLMLVDDNDGDIELTQILLVENSHLKCNFSVAHDGSEAMDKMRAAAKSGKPIDIILLDINMPVMDGFELLEKMRAEKIFEKVQVVICTTSTYDKDLEKAKSLGVAGYITKPADLSKLKPILEKSDHLRFYQGDNFCSILRNAG